MGFLMLVYLVKLQSQLDDFAAVRNNEQRAWNLQPRSKVKDGVGAPLYLDLPGTRQLQQTTSTGDGIPFRKKDINEHPVQDVWGPQQLSSPPANEEKFNVRVSVLVESFVRPATESLADFIRLQCWAGKRGWSVVEPWLHESQLGTPLRYSHDQGTGYIEMNKLFDMSHWSTYSYKNGMASLISASQFLNRGPWNAILVSSRHSDNCLNPPGAYDTLGLEVVKQICINDTQLSTESLERITDTVVHMSQDGNVAVIIKEWMTDDVGSTSQSTNHCMTLSKDIGAMRPSSEVMNDAQRYTDLHLNGEEYVSVVLDAKAMPTAACFQQIHKHLGQSNTANIIIITRGYEHEEQQTSLEFLESVERFLNSTTTIGSKWREVASINNSQYISLMQQTVAFNAHCVLLASQGHYQDYIVLRYRENHQQHRQHTCFAVIKECFDVP